MGVIIPCPCPGMPDIDPDPEAEAVIGIGVDSISINPGSTAGAGANPYTASEIADKSTAGGPLRFFTSTRVHSRANRLHLAQGSLAASGWSGGTRGVGSHRLLPLRQARQPIRQQEIYAGGGDLLVKPGLIAFFFLPEEEEDAFPPPEACSSPSPSSSPSGSSSSSSVSLILVPLAELRLGPSTPRGKLSRPFRPSDMPDRDSPFALSNDSLAPNSGGYVPLRTLRSDE